MVEPLAGSPVAVPNAFLKASDARLDSPQWLAGTPGNTLQLFLDALQASGLEKPAEIRLKNEREFMRLMRIAAAEAKQDPQAFWQSGGPCMFLYHGVTFTYLGQAR